VIGHALQDSQPPSEPQFIRINPLLWQWSLDLASRDRQVSPAVPLSDGRPTVQAAAGSGVATVTGFAGEWAFTTPRQETRAERRVVAMVS
jgi:hypothetical protein